MAASLTVAEQLVPRWLGEFHAIRPTVRPGPARGQQRSRRRGGAQGRADIGFVETTRVLHDVA